MGLAALEIQLKTAWQVKTLQILTPNFNLSTFQLSLK